MLFTFSLGLLSQKNDTKQNLNKPGVKIFFLTTVFFGCCCWHFGFLKWHYYHHLLKLVKLTWNVLTFFLALAEALDSDPELPAPLFEDDTWSAGKDSGTGCNVGVLMVLEAAEVVVKTDVGPEDMTLSPKTLVKFWFQAVTFLVVKNLITLTLMIIQHCAYYNMSYYTHF